MRFGAVIFLVARQQGHDLDRYRGHHVQWIQRQIGILACRHGYDHGLAEGF